MLSLSQKESILRKKNVTIPAFPRRSAPHRYHGYDDLLLTPMHELEERQLRIAVVGWRAEVEALYRAHIALNLQPKGRPVGEDP